MFVNVGAKRFCCGLKYLDKFFEMPKILFLKSFSCNFSVYFQIAARSRGASNIDAMVHYEIAAS